MWRLARPGTRRGRLILRVVFYSTFLFVALPLAFSHVMLRTYPQPLGSPPPGYAQIAIRSEGLRLSAWLVRGDAARPAVVVVHGVGDTLAAYADVASHFNRRGHTVLLLGLRGHGTSEGRHTTLGAREKEDVRAAMAHLRGGGLAASGLILSGVSMGAVAVLRAAADQPDVRAVIAEAPFDTYRLSIERHARLLYGVPRWVPLIPLAILAAEWRGGFAADEVDAIAAAREIRAPLLAIVDGEDARMPEDVVRRVYDAHPGPKRFWVAPGAEHAGALFSPGYWSQVDAFLEECGL
jgi:pimeloyl-ACP methyl ester carboxylesterase